MVVELACMEDVAAWLELDKEADEPLFARMVAQERGYVLKEQGRVLGVLRYGMFWDHIPFCYMLVLAKDKQRQGYGRELLFTWEEQMRKQGYDMVLTSTRADEAAQHFYRACGYCDCGGLLLRQSGYEQPLELFLCKDIRME